MRLRSLSSRMVLVYVALFTLVQLCVLLLVDRVSIRLAHDRNVQELQVGERVLRRVIDQNRQRLLQAAEVLAMDFAFRAAIATGDSPTIASVLNKYGARIQASVMMLVSPEDRLIADSLHPDRAGALFSQPDLMRAAQQEGRASAIMQMEGRAYQVVVVPVLAPDPIAWVAMGFLIDEAFLRDLRTLTSLHVSFIAPERSRAWTLLATTQPQPEVEQALSVLPRATDKMTAPVQIGDFDTLISTIEQDGNQPLSVVLQRSITEGLESLGRLKSLLVLLTIASIAACAVGSVVLARRVTQPLLELARFAGRVRDGDYSGRLQLRRTDEIGELSSSFTHMLEGIAAREKEILRLAYEDSLSGLPNRAMFNARLAEAVRSHQSTRTPVSVLVMDLDRFKTINDTLGHEAGDLVLREVARRLRAAVRESDTVARLGGDEFGVLLTAGAERATVLARMIPALLEAPIDLDGQAVDMGCSIGIAQCPAHGDEPGILMQRADIAMYAAKREKSGFAVYDARYDSHRAEHLSLLGDLRQAIADDRLRLHYQPKIDLRRRQLAGVEALVRWEHPERGLLPPAEFIPFAEQTGTIRQVTRWVIQEALRQCGTWYADGHALGVSINVSTRDLLDRDFAQFVETAARRHGVPAELLTIEVTESALVDDPQRARETIRRLKQSGVKLSIDDYGTGYSSLANIQRLQFDELKVDRSFVTHIATRAKDAAIVRSTIELGHNLGLTVVAEGVEDEQAIDLLRELGCDQVQGFEVSRPLPCDKVADWIAASEWAARRAARVVDGLRLAR